jgi:hypothetical protein
MLAKFANCELELVSSPCLLVGFFVIAWTNSRERTINGLNAIVKGLNVRAAG